ncbi:MAG: hypothetical protein WAW85_08335, partial [Gordonia sp. (in: high G+C Gram-positive bacteria)]|uniref:hypothetical protein n=1 Tax=Gordonia sp. (in: high G+C Gram-positive bacteria) TaxID=84139 RepID=UPI003BB5F4AC
VPTPPVPTPPVPTPPVPTPPPTRPSTPRPQVGPDPGPIGGGQTRMPPQYGRPTDPLDPNVSLEELKAEAPRVDRRRERSEQISVHELLRRTRDADDQD